MRKGRLTSLSTWLESLVWAPYFVFPYIYNPPDWGWFWSYESQHGPLLNVIGVVLILVGFASIFISLFYLGLSRSLGQEVNLLKRSGLYRVSRNPQIITGVPLVVGYVVLLPSWYAIGWMMLYAVMAHMMVMTEEEHLNKIHGESYIQYCEQVPRYIGYLGNHNKKQEQD
jgi:protein-S-isoprenylcysteine O-methyltransferase Ste14